MNFSSLGEFWAFYMSQHSKASTRRWHFGGTISTILIYSVAFKQPLLVIFAVLIGYGVAWCNHFLVEDNFPASFGNPIWSIICDLKMFGLMITGQMDKKIKRLGKRPVLQSS